MTLEDGDLKVGFVRFELVCQGQGTCYAGDTSTDDKDLASPRRGIGNGDREDKAIPGLAIFL
jgi:hypothetical protein